MNILVTNNTFSFTGGSETYAYAVIAELVRQGHNVDAFTTGPVTMIGEEIRKLGVQIFYKTVPRKNYDFVIGSHTSTFEHLDQYIGKKIQTCHGIFPALEQPYRGIEHVAISKEVHDHIKTKGMTSTIIHNGVDCERFKPTKELNTKMKKILSLSHDQSVNQLLEQACRVAGIEFEWQNKYINPMINIEDKIQDADLVVTLGRGAYESMAAGRPVLIYDKRGYSGLPAVGDGILTLDNIDKALENNCSGRATKKEFTIASMVEEFKKYNPELGDQMRTYALENFNIETNMKKYLEL